MEQQWIHIDNQMKELNERMRMLREKKQAIAEQILTNIQQDQDQPLTNLRIANVKETQPLTFVYLEKCLSEIIKNKENVDKIIGYIKGHREVKYVSEIKRV
jgi:hypothetical protein